MTFALDLQRFAEKAREKADDAVAAIVIEVASEIDRLSPVGDAAYWASPPPPGYVGGRFRGNWQLGVDVRKAGVVARIDPGGEQTKAEIIATVPDNAAGHVYNLSNNLPYAMRLEMGYSRQAPTGMVGITATRFQQIVSEQIAKLP